MLVVSDTSPLNGLFRIGQTHLLEVLFAKVIIPREVAEELSAIEVFGFDPKFYQDYAWIEIHESPSYTAFQETLDRGESAALALAKELHADILLIDELKARGIAKQEGFRVIGILGILLLAKSEGHISSVVQPMDKLINEVGFWIDRSLYQKIKSLAGE